MLFNALFFGCIVDLPSSSVLPAQLQDFTEPVVLLYGFCRISTLIGSDARKIVWKIPGFSGGGTPPDSSC